MLAVSGDGGAMYGIAELATARQHDLPVTWLIVDDGGYGILREYMTGAFGSAFGTELARPDFVALAQAFGVPARETTPGDAARRTCPRHSPRTDPTSSYCPHCCRCSPRRTCRPRTDRPTGRDGYAAVGSGESLAGYFLTKSVTTSPLTLPQSCMRLSLAPQCEMPMCLPAGNLP